MKKLTAAKQRREEVPTAEESHTLLAILLKASLAIIAYHRGFFPDENFEDTQLMGINMIKFKRYPVDPLAVTFNAWLEEGSVFEDLRKEHVFPNSLLF